MVLLKILLCASQFPRGKLSYMPSKSKHNACFWLLRPEAPWDGLFNGCLYKVEMVPSLFSTPPVAEPGKGRCGLEVGDPVELLGSRKLQSHQFCAMDSRRLLKYANIAPRICASHTSMMPLISALTETLELSHSDKQGVRGFPNAVDGRIMGQQTSDCVQVLPRSDSASFG